MSKIFVDQVDPKTGTSLTLGTSGDTVNIPSGVTLANAGTVTGLPASAITTGTMATARLGSGTASSSTFLRGDQTYAAAGGANTPTFLAGLSGDKGTYGAGATTKVQFDNQIVDTDNAYDPSTNYRFTVPSGGAGNYMINISLDIQSSSNGRATNVSIYKNGGMVTTGGYFLSSQYFQNDQPNVNTISQMLNLSVGDYIEAYGFMYDGGNHTFKASRSFFSGYKLIA